VDVLILLVFVSIMILAGAIILLLRSVWHGDYDHAERLALLPLEPDDDRDAAPSTSAPQDQRDEKGERLDHALDAR